jgi:hypothetical protein
MVRSQSHLYVLRRFDWEIRVCVAFRLRSDWFAMSLGCLYAISEFPITCVGLSMSLALVCYPLHQFVYFAWRSKQNTHVCPSHQLCVLPGGPSKIHTSVHHTNCVFCLEVQAKYTRLSITPIVCFAWRSKQNTHVCPSHHIG